MTNQTTFHPPYQSAHGRARLVVVLLIVGAVISLLTIPSHVLDLYVTPLSEDQEISDNPLGFVALALTGVLGLAAIAVYIATVVVFLMWLYRVSKNVAAFGASTQHSAGWAVGSFFVPIINLFVPYQAIKDIWKKSEPAGTDAFSSAVSPPGIFPAWWGFWIASNFAANIYFRMTLSDAPVETAAIVGILSEILSVAAAVFAIQVVREIDRRQEERAKNLPQQGVPTPPPPPVFEGSQSSTSPAANDGPVTAASSSPATNPSGQPDQSNSDTTGA